MRTKTPKKNLPSRDWRRSALAVLVIVCLLLSQLNLNSMVAYATSSGPVVMSVGSNVTARLDEGVLTLTGTGDTDDYTAESAPFAVYAGEIHTLVIEEGITYIGAYLFYDAGAVTGDLTLPGSIVGFGDYAFSGSSAECAPHFSVIQNLFERGEVSRLEQPVQMGGSSSSAVEQEKTQAQPEIDADSLEMQPEQPATTEPAEKGQEPSGEESTEAAETPGQSTPSDSGESESTAAPETEAGTAESVSSQTLAGAAELTFAAAYEARAQRRMTQEASPQRLTPMRGLLTAVVPLLSKTASMALLTLLVKMLLALEKTWAIQRPATVWKPSPSRKSVSRTRFFTPARAELLSVLPAMLPFVRPC